MPKRNVIMIDPTLEYERMLRYREKHAAWELFRTVFWSIYMLVIAILLVTDVPATLTLEAFFGWVFLLGALFTTIYGISMVLHLRLMRKYG